MKLRERIFGERKSVGWLFDMMRAPGTIGKDYQDQATKGYDNVYVRRCVETISMACGGIEWDLYRPRGKELVEVEQHPLLDLMRRPNPWMGQSAFMQSAVAYLMLDGNSYLWANRPENRKIPIELLTLRPDRMKPRVERGEVVAYDYTINGSTTPLRKEDVLHLRLFNPLDDVLGLSPIQSAALSILTGNQAKRWNLSLLQNGARPMGALSSQGTLTDDQYERLKGEFDVKYVGQENAGKPVVLEGGVQWQEMSLSPADMSWLESQKLSAREIAICYGVPPEMIGDSSNKTYSNYREARRAFYQETALPLMDSIQGEFGNWLVPMYDPALSYRYDRDDIDALQEDRTELWTRLGAASWLTLNEKREACGYEAIEGGDVILVPATMLPVDAQVPAANVPTQDGKQR